MGHGINGPKAPGLNLKRHKKRTKGSSTSGKSKGLLPGPEDRGMAKRNRSHKDQGYDDWCQRMDVKVYGPGGYRGSY